MWITAITLITVKQENITNMQKKGKPGLLFVPHGFVDNHVEGQKEL